MKNPFKNEIKEPEIVEETPNLKVKINRLQSQASILMGKITAESHIPTKKRLSALRADVLRQINGLTLKMNSEQENNALKLLDELFNKNKKYLIFYVNTRRTDLTENFTTTLKFKPCGHKREFHLKEMLTLQKPLINNKVLLTKWQAILTSNMTMETRFSCEECKNFKAKKLSMWKTHTDADVIGTVKVSLTKI